MSRMVTYKEIVQEENVQVLQKALALYQRIEAEVSQNEKFKYQIAVPAPGNLAPYVPLEHRFVSEVIEDRLRFMEGREDIGYLQRLLEKSEKAYDLYLALEKNTPYNELWMISSPAPGISGKLLLPTQVLEQEMKKLKARIEALAP